MPEAGSETGVYLEYLKLCLKLYRKLSIYLTHIPDLLFKLEMPRRNVALNMPAWVGYADSQNLIKVLRLTLCDMSLAYTAVSKVHDC